MKARIANFVKERNEVLFSLDRDRIEAYLDSKDSVELCIAIKQAFAKAHIYIHSDPEADIDVSRERFITWRKRSRK